MFSVPFRFRNVKCFLNSIQIYMPVKWAGNIRGFAEQDKAWNSPCLGSTQG